MATQTPPPAIDTSALTPQFQALYDEQLPALQKAQTQAAQARGMFYSGDALNTQTLAQEQLLASLLAQQQAQTQQTAINTQNINQANNAQSNATVAANRAQNIGLIGGGVGAAAALGAAVLGKTPVKNIFQSGGNTYSLDSTGKATQIALPGQNAVGGAGMAPGDGIGGPGTSAGPSDVPGGGGPPSAMPSMGGLQGTAATPSPTTLDGLSGSDPMMSTLPGVAANPGVGLAGDVGGMSSLPSSGLDGLTNLASGDLGSIGGDAADAGIGALASFAKGGIVSKPTIAQIGDAGPGNPEEVIPLNKLQAAVGPRGAAAVMAAVPQPGAAPAQSGTVPGSSMWMVPTPPQPQQPPQAQPLNALQGGGLLGNLFKP